MPGIGNNESEKKGELMDIQMVDLRAQYLRIKPEIDAAIQGVLDSTAFIKGQAVTDFESALSDFHGAHCVTCGNGTDALHIAMMALDFKPGDEIIVPVFTYVATAEVIALLGLKPVFVDVDEKTFNIDVNQVESRVTSRTKAIVPVHLFGQCANMGPLVKIAEKFNLRVIEDYAQAFGAKYHVDVDETAIAGTMGIIGCTSFFPSKNLGAYGDGGALTTMDKGLAEKIRTIANHGQRIKYYHDLVGVNSRLDTLQAAILLVKLRYIKEYEAKRTAVGDYYDQHLSGLDFLTLPHRFEKSSHVFHQYTVKVNGNREEFREYLNKKGIPSMVYYPVPLHLQKAYQNDQYSAGSFPVAERLSAQVVSLPIHTEMSETQLSYICDSIRSYRP